MAQEHVDGIAKSNCLFAAWFCFISDCSEFDRMVHVVENSQGQLCPTKILLILHLYPRNPLPNKQYDKNAWKLTGYIMVLLLRTTKCIFVFLSNIK